MNVVATWATENKPDLQCDDGFAGGQLSFTPDQPRKVLHVVHERLARSICAAHHDCDMYDGYVTLHWRTFLPGAIAAYKELLKIDEERATNPTKG